VYLASAEGFEEEKTVLLPIHHQALRMKMAQLFPAHDKAMFNI
jgi:hypothetical protein